MPAHLVLQGPSDIQANDTSWTDIPGLFNAVLTRSALLPATLECQLTAMSADASAVFQRWYPFMNLRLVVRNLTPPPGWVLPAPPPDTVLFVGRLDHAEKIEQGALGPAYWYLTARDWLSVLADNSIGNGLWRILGGPGLSGSALPSIRNLPMFVPSRVYWPSYIDNYTGANPQRVPPYGEYRKFIVADLALNVVASVDAQGNPHGLLDVDISLAPNSDAISENMANMGAQSILQAIQEIAISDPWNLNAGVPNPNQPIDAAWLDLIGYPTGFGVGAMFQIQELNGLGFINLEGAAWENTDGRRAMYCVLGIHNTGAHLVHQFNPLPGIAAPITNYIEQHNFNREGYDIWSRVSPLGSGNTNNNQPPVGVPPDGSSASVVALMEQVWDPTNGYYRVRREANLRMQTLTGTAIFKLDSDPKAAAQSRPVNDAALGQLIAGAAGDGSTNAGQSNLNQGTVVVPGPPFSFSPAAAGVGIGEWIPGFSVLLTIPSVNIVEQLYTIDQVRYQWPDDRSYVTLSRINYSDVRRQLLALSGRTATANAGHANIYTSAWTPTAGQNAITFRPALGVQNAKVQVDAAFWDGQSRDATGAPTPKPGTLVSVQVSGWEAAQGQHYGFYILQNDIDFVVIGLNKWLANSPGAPGNGWLAADSPNTIIRLSATPS